MTVKGSLPFFNEIKTRCAMCGKKYYPRFCKSCRRKDHSLCDSCHKTSKSHKMEASKLYAK